MYADRPTAPVTRGNAAFTHFLTRKGKLWTTYNTAARTTDQYANMQVDSKSVAALCHSL